MEWKEKIRIAIERLNEDPMFSVVFGIANPDTEFVIEIEKKNPLLDADYLEFLSLTNGAHFWMYVLAGSGSSTFVSIDQLNTRWFDFTSSLDVFPIGESPSGECIGITKSGAVLEFDYTVESLGDCKQLAPSFAGLVDDFLMGEGFAGLFGNPEDDLKDDLWAQFLREHGWM